MGIWHDPDIMAVRDESRDAFELLIYTTTCPHSNMLGLYRLPLDYASADLGWELKRLRKAFALLKKRRLVEYDRQAEVVWCPNILAWQPLENSNQAVGAVRQLTALPETRLLEHLRTALAPGFGRKGKSGEAILGPIAEFFGETVPQGERSGKGRGNGSETVSKPEAFAVAVAVTDTETGAVTGRDGPLPTSFPLDGQEEKLRAKCREYFLDGIVTDQVVSKLVRFGEGLGLTGPAVRAIVLAEQPRVRV
jgi:hypothetical protein